MLQLPGVSLPRTRQFDRKQSNKTFCIQDFTTLAGLGTSPVKSLWRVYIPFSDPSVSGGYRLFNKTEQPQPLFPTNTIFAVLWTYLAHRALLQTPDYGILQGAPLTSPGPGPPRSARPAAGRQNAGGARVSRGFAGPEGTGRGGSSTAGRRAHHRAGSREAGAEAAGRRRPAPLSARDVGCLRGHPGRALAGPRLPPLSWHRPARCAGPRARPLPAVRTRAPRLLRLNRAAPGGLGGGEARKTPMLQFPRAGILSEILPWTFPGSLILYSQTLSCGTYRKCIPKPSAARHKRFNIFYQGLPYLPQKELRMLLS
ncbi:uncharacterized protein LOC133252701 [Bos javanicus]|uniref:uncharacterized protein LOC133252701 n=1 Tax=Bos javanicus TaxID=9906 RepID=UPI002AA669E2|nr:uncharacterized protein LOC133252701 [Bos javanicus]